MNGPFGNGFPYTNFHELNMDWIIRIAKDFLDQYTHIQDIISSGETSLQETTAAGIEALQAEKTRLEGLLDAWYTEHSEDIAGELASAISDFQTAAESIGAEVIASIPEDYTALSGTVETLQDDLAYDESVLFEGNYFDEISVVSGGVNTSNGANNAEAKRARTVYLALEPNTSYLFKLDSTDYCIINCWLYSAQTGSTGAERAVYSGNSDPICREVKFTTASENELYCRVTFAANDKTTELSETDYAAIEAAISLKVRRLPFIFRGWLSELEYTTLASCVNPGWYGLATGDISNITDLPTTYGTSGGGTLIVYSPAMAKPNNVNNWVNQILFNTNGKSWWRKLQKNGSSISSWISQEGEAADKFVGKKVAILGASNDTNGNPDGINPYPNAVEMTITSEDIGVELSAYLTYYDVQAELSLGGHTFTNSEIGTEVTFTPTSDDIGKVIGLPNNYNLAAVKVWWEVAAEKLGFTPIPVCWSGASITSHEGSSNTLKTSYAWHDAQIRKCGIRTPGTMTRTAPDVIIITRGLNDYGHTPYTVLTDDYFNNENYQYPITDDLGDNSYGFYEGLALTIKKLRDAYPKAQIMIATMKMALRPAGGYSTFPPRNGTNTILQYSEAFRKTADFFGCQVLELDKCGITYENFLDNYCADTSSATPSHANNAGHRLMGDRAIIDLMKLNF